MESALIERIYEAAVVPTEWPALLAFVGEHLGTKGGLLFAYAGQDTRVLGGGPAVQMAEEFLREGWMAPGRGNDRAEFVLRRNWPGFVTETDFAPEDEWASRPVFREFLIPRGYFATAGTLVHGLGMDKVMISFEGFSSHAAARAAIPRLDALRPHFARAAQIASQFSLERMRGSVEALAAIGAAAGVLGMAGNLRMANDLLNNELGSVLVDGQARLRLIDKRADHFLEDALEGFRTGTCNGRSIVLRDRSAGTRVMHLLPLRGQANDLFSSASALVVLTNPQRTLEVNTEVLLNLFDLTPAEARLAGRACSGELSLPAIASEFGVSINTIRTQLQSLFDKTGSKRQADLARLLIAAGTR
jgi:DNA-binding CsgD family transcriptional regulator